MGDARSPSLVVVSWIRWHARSHGLARLLGGEAVFMPWAVPRLPRRRLIAGYLRSGVRTWRLVRCLSPGSVVIAMSPPVFNPLVVLAASLRRGVTLVIDAHSGAFNDERWAWAHTLQRWAVNRSKLLLVTNEEILHEVPSFATDVAVMHDPLIFRPEGEIRRPTSALASSYVVFPASGAADEPIAGVRDAAAILAKRGMYIVVTGRHPDLPESPGLQLPGYLPNGDYRQLLQGACAVLALTDREATMQRAAYEALEVKVPIICSDTRVLRTVLGGAAVHTGHSGREIAAAVEEVLERRAEMMQAVALVRETIMSEVTEASQRVLALLQAPGTDDTAREDA